MRHATPNRHRDPNAGPAIVANIERENALPEPTKAENRNVRTVFQIKVEPTYLARLNFCDWAFIGILFFPHFDI
jgi:hypothetical protein